jgi:hypothetical protein
MIICIAIAILITILFINNQVNYIWMIIGWIIVAAIASILIYASKLNSDDNITNKVSLDNLFGEHSSFSQNN